ncbi:MAG: vWA domain-containing protein [Limisphaerales bacterium]
MDIAFIVDNTGSMSDAPLTQLKNRIANVLDTIEAASGNDYRLALVTPDDDQVDVMLSFSINNRSAFVTALNAVTDPPNNGDGTPESTDECLNTVLNALSAANRQNPRECSPPSSPLQYNNFTPGFRTNVLKLVVMITDHEPGGFCDNGDNGYQAGIYAQQARDNCVHINAVQVGNNRDATPVMQNYYQTSCGWHEQVGYDGIGIADDVVRMFYVSGYCNCQ